MLCATRSSKCQRACCSRTASAKVAPPGTTVTKPAAVLGEQLQPVAQPRVARQAAPSLTTHIAQRSEAASAATARAGAHRRAAR